MDLKLFFDPIDEEVYRDISHAASFYHNISVFKEELPGIIDADIAIIGVPEGRGNEANEGTGLAPDKVRRKLYNLKKGMGRYRVIDLGNLRTGITLDDTYLRIREVCNHLLSADIIPVIIGGSHDLDYGQYLAYQDLEKLVTVLSVDAEFDMNEVREDVIPATSHIQRILLHQPNYLFNFCQLGYQSYLNSQEEMEIFEKLYFEVIRLGVVREKLQEMEPVIRDADMLSVDVTSIRQTDAPGNENRKAFGLTGEEACQLCWYAGQSDKLSSAGFYEFNPELDVNGQTASVVATMIWYFIEGYYNRKGDKNFRGNQYLKYVVSMPNHPNALVFYKSKLNDKWWLEVAYESERIKNRKAMMVPCTYDDYQTANSGELPNRWVTTYAKLMGE
jgi:formiminoglutamase